MIFNSFEFAIFLPIVFFLYWFIFNKKLFLQNLFLLTVSYLFYGWWDWRFLFLIFASSLVDFLVSLMMTKTESPKIRKSWLAVSLIINLGSLGIFKYFNFFSSSLKDAFETVGITLDDFTLDVVLPVGISFYTFQTLSYTIDVYNRKIRPTNHLISFFAFVSFFPQLVAGPIERASHLLPAFLKERRFSYIQAVEGVRLVLYGFFKKIVIADNAAYYVNQIFDTYEYRSGLELALGVFLFAFQIYGDFSGYSDIATGISKLFGFELMNNFQVPYFSKSIPEFWRRWHISLTSWFKDYLYLPLGGSREGQFKTLRNVIIIFLVSGIWHGANWTFVIWGGLNAMFFIPFGIKRKSFDKNKPSPSAINRIIKDSFGMITTFFLICFAWIFFRAPDLFSAVAYIGSFFKNPFLGETLIRIPGMFWVIFVGFMMLEWKIKENGLNHYLSSCNRFARLSFNYITIILIIFWGSFSSSEFIYFQF